MITNILSRSKLKQLFLELFINKTDKATDVSDNSVTNAVAFGVATIAQKALKDIAVVESQIMPDSASGAYLDNAATLFGVSARKSASQSSTYLRIVASESTFYDKSLVSFTNYNGIRFIPEEDLTIGVNGFGYLKVRSEDTGTKTNVDPNSIITINSAPTGHIGVTNEYMSTGGRDIEDDETFRKRIKKHDNIIARYTLEYYTKIFQEYNDDVLRVVNKGINNEGKQVLVVLSQNGIDFTESELSDLLENTKSYFSISDLNKFGDIIGIELVNPTWYIIGDPADDDTGTGVDFRVQLWDGYDSDVVRKNIQINISKYIDYRFWQYGKKVEWDDLLQIVKNIEGVRYVPDNFFFPNQDEIVPVNQFPRIKKFIMRDVSGNIISDTSGNITPIFYPNNI